jgi:hypothetical protein
MCDNKKRQIIIPDEHRSNFMSNTVCTGQTCIEQLILPQVHGGSSTEYDG